MLAPWEIVAAIAGGGVLALFAMSKHGVRQSAEDAVQKVTSAANEGRFADALRIAEETLKERSVLQADEGVLLMFIGLAHARSGHFELAIDHLERSGALVPAELVRLVYTSLALVFALQGDLAAATRSLEYSKNKGGRLGEDTELQAEVVILLRCGKPGRAAQLLQTAEQRLERTLTVREIRGFYLLLAFALAAHGGDRTTALQVALSRARGIGEVAYLTAAWPELAAFVQAEGVK